MSSLHRFAFIVLLGLCGSLLTLQPVAARALQNPYVAAGVPAPDKMWNGHDYEAVAAVFESGKVALPMLDDGFGSDILGRILNLENLAPCRDPAIALTERMHNYGRIQTAYSRILAAYSRKAEGDAKMHAELARLLAFSLHAGALAVELMDEMPKEEATAQAVVDGRRQLNVGLTLVFASIEPTIGKPGLFDAVDQSLLIAALATTFKYYRPALVPEYRNELRETLARHMETFIGEDLAHLKSMYDVLPTPIVPFER